MLKKLQFDSVDIWFIFTSLLIGAIDCDRMEYISTDRLNTMGEIRRYDSIFDSIKIALLNDNPSIEFEYEALSTIEDMTFGRASLYNKIYYEIDGVILELKLQEYSNIMGWDEQDISSITEYEVLTQLKQILDNPNSKGTVKRRIAEVILKSERGNIVYKKFNSEEEMDVFLKKIKSITKRDELINVINKKIVIYDSKKNKVNIEDKNGVVRDLKDISQRVKEETVRFNYVIMDLDPAYHLGQKEVEKLRELFTSNEVEIEKKFSLPFYTGQTPNVAQNILFRVQFAINSGLYMLWKENENDDQYFESAQVPSNYAMRYRKCDYEESCFYLKMPIDDGTSITKRQEQKIYCLDCDEFIEFLKEVLKSNGEQVPEKIELKKAIRIKTKRYKSLLDYRGSKIEVSCDFSTFTYGKIEKNGFMLECELKAGDDIALWFLTKDLKDCDFVEINESKEAMGKRLLNIQ